MPNAHVQHRPEKGVQAIFAIAQAKNPMHAVQKGASVGEYEVMVHCPMNLESNLVFVTDPRS